MPDNAEALLQAVKLGQKHLGRSQRGCGGVSLRAS